MDSFETRVYLMLIHFSIILLIFKRKSLKFNQDKYDSLFHNIENNLRELGFGDVSVNKKMKDLNKILYDILLKINIKGVEKFEINGNLLTKYFNNINTSNNRDLVIFKEYFIKFYDFCFELSPDIMVREAVKFNYGSS